MTDFLVAALYKFVHLPDYAALQKPLLGVCQDAGVMGTVLLAHEGINGTIAGSEDGVRAVLAWLRHDPRLSDLTHKGSRTTQPPFLRMKVRLKREIVTMGQPRVDPRKAAGTYVAPEDWNELISDPDVILVDTRNRYEVEIGTFRGALNPETGSFREFPAWAQNSDLLDRKNKKRVAMFCTGGIRCEKSTAWLRQQGVEEVYHLQGGILKYLETVPEAESLWQGECFVFDQRVSVGHGLKPGSYDMCHACRHAIDEEAMASPHYVPGVSCPKCHGSHSQQQIKRYTDRQQQMTLAKNRKTTHLGSPALRTPHTRPDTTPEPGPTPLGHIPINKI